MTADIYFNEEGYKLRSSVFLAVSEPRMLFECTGKRE